MRQTNFFQAPADEQELLAHVFQASPGGQEVVILDVAGARSEAAIGVYRAAAEVPPVGPNREHELLHLANLGLDLPILYRRTEGGPHAGELRIDEGVSPVVELHRSSRMGNQLLRGRIYAIDRDLVAAEADPEAAMGLFDKGQSFRDWLNEITRWLRARYLRTTPPGPFLVGPHAAAWHRAGGELAECGFRYQVEGG